jgi:hypothetical protein
MTGAPLDWPRPSLDNVFMLVPQGPRPGPYGFVGRGMAITLLLPQTSQAI